jgi:hypothetical protein
MRSQGQSNLMFRCTTSAVLLTIAGFSPRVSAQLPSAATAGLGMADNYTAAARGYNATRWNPANLGLRGNPTATVAFFPTRGIAGLDPVTLGDLADFSGIELPADVRQRWLDQITSNGREQGSGGAEVTIVAAQVGPVGFQVGVSANAVADVPPGAAQLLLFGNVDPNTGQPVSVAFEDGSIDAAIASTAALAYAHAIDFGVRKQHRFSAGATLKYTVGHFLLMSEDHGGATSNPLALDVTFPTISTDTTSFFNNGAGFGVDLGAGYQTGMWTVTGTVQNVFSSFKWREGNLRYRPGRAIFNADSSSAEFDELDVSVAPENLRQKVLDLRYKPNLSIGTAVQPDDRLTLSADFRTRLSDEGIAFGPKTHAGIGAEYRVLPFLPVRAGIAKVTGGMLFAGGLGVDLGVFSIAVSAARRSGDLGHDQMGMFTILSSWPRASAR